MQPTFARHWVVALVIIASSDVLIASEDTTLLQSELLWNGSSVGSTGPSSRPSTGAQFNGRIPGVKAGANTLGLRIVSETVSPSTYSLLGIITASRADGTQQTFHIFIADTSLSTGQVITFPITITP